MDRPICEDIMDICEEVESVEIDDLTSALKGRTDREKVYALRTLLRIGGDLAVGIDFDIHPKVNARLRDDFVAASEAFSAAASVLWSLAYDVEQVLTDE